jgi:CubicO group peptidase (beta-lactamase class C family)
MLAYALVALLLHDQPFGAGKTAAASALIREAVAQGKTPGLVAVAGDARLARWEQAFGNRQVKPATELATLDTVWDMASLTKPVATATSVWILVDKGRIDPDQPVSRYLPDFKGDARDKVTVRHLLTHTSGLPAGNSLEHYKAGKEAARARLCATPLQAAPGAKFTYSDLGFILLGWIVEDVSGQPLDRFARDNIFKPLGMNDTGYLPDAALKARCAATGADGVGWLKGRVHDPRANLMGGVAGHAGLFSTGPDMARYARMVLNKGELDGARIMSAETLGRMIRPEDVPGGKRAPGWDSRTGYSTQRGIHLSEKAVGHGGFTGTSMWIDPERGLFIVLLATRLHPDGKGVVNPLFGAVATALTAP